MSPLASVSTQATRMCSTWVITWMTPLRRRSCRHGGPRASRIVEVVDARPGEQPLTARAPSTLVHGVEDAALEVEVRAGVEDGVARRPHGLVQDHVAIGAALQAGDAVPLEQELPVDVVSVLEE